MRRALLLLRRRLILSVPVLLLVVIGTFFLLEAAGGDAVDAYAGEIGADAGTIERLRVEWGLAEGPFTRLLTYLWSLVHLDLGWSVSQSRPIVEVLLERLPVTLLLMGSSIAFSFGVGAVLGIAAGARPSSIRDRSLSIGALALYAVPGFWLGLVLQLTFSVSLGWLPFAGFETIASGLSGPRRALDIAWHLVLPTLSLGLIYLALYLRVMRSGMAEIWRTDFIRNAVAKGIPRRRIVLRHVARNALLPLVTILGTQAATMLGGSVVIESVFGVPGLGLLAEAAVRSRDTPLLLGIVLISAVTVVIVNLVIDVAYAFLDPRIGSGPERAA